MKKILKINDIPWRSIPNGPTKWESLWSLVHKYAFLNSFSSSEISQLLSLERISDANHTPLLHSAALLGPLSSGKLQRYLHLSESNVLQALPRYYALSLGTNYQLTSHKSQFWLRYCPTCIEGGFHTALFQMPWINQCPVHQEQIREECPLCGQKIAYSLDYQALIYPYGCSCGYLLWEHRDDYEWEAPLEQHELALLSDFIKYLNTLGTRVSLRDAAVGLADGPWNTANAAHSLHYLPFRLSTAVSSNNLFSNYLCGESKSSLSTNAQYGGKVNICPIYSDELVDQITGEGILEEVEEQVNGLYRSIKRRIFRTIMYSHRHCLRDYRHSLIRRSSEFDKSRQYCGWAIVMENWEAYWDQYKSDFLRTNLQRKLKRGPVQWYAATMCSIFGSVGRLPEFRYEKWIVSHLLAAQLVETFRWFVHQLGLPIEEVQKEKKRKNGNPPQGIDYFIVVRKADGRMDRVMTWGPPVSKQLNWQAPSFPCRHFSELSHTLDYSNRMLGEIFSNMSINSEK